LAISVYSPHKDYFVAIFDNITDRKRAEEAQRESEMRFRELFNRMSNGVAVYEAVENGGDFIIKDFNPAAEKIEKVSRKDILGKRVSEAFPGVKAFGVFQVFQRVWQTGKPEYYPENIYKDERDIGSWRESWVFKLPTGEIVAIYNDITERKRAEAALRESDQQYQTIGETIPYGVWLTDATGYCTYVSKSFLELVDMTMEQVQAFGWLHLLPPEDVEPTKEHWLHCVQTGEFFEREHRFKTRDGSYINVLAIGRPIRDDNGKIARWAGINLDITARKRTEQTLRESEAKYRILIEQAWDAIFVIDQGGKILFVNKQACEILGYTQAELTQLNVADTYFAEERAAMAERIAKVQRGEHLRYESSMVRKDGTTFPVEVSIGMLPKGLIQGIVRDVTVRREAEEALHKSESNLRALAMELSRAEESERKRLALFLHDEIGQSLALLRMKLGSLAGRSTLKSENHFNQQILDLLEKTIEQTHTLTFELSPPVLHQLGLEAAIEWAGEKISGDHGIEFAFSDDGRMKPFDDDIKAFLFRCVRELMLNIVKHAKARRMTVSLKRAQNQFYAVIEDNGIGFDTSLLKQSQDLPGFGLYSVREHLAAMGGTFEIQSEPGRGTRVTLSVLLQEEMPSS
jgi:PAS domain S-box-containing protein